MLKPLAKLNATGLLVALALGSNRRELEAQASLSAVRPRHVVVFCMVGRRMLAVAKLVSLARLDVCHLAVSGETRVLLRLLYSR